MDYYHSVNFVGGYIRTLLTRVSRAALFELKFDTFSNGLATTTNDGNVFPCILQKLTSLLSAVFLLISSLVKSTTLSLEFLLSADETCNSFCLKASADI